MLLLSALLCLDGAKGQCSSGKRAASGDSGQNVDRAPYEGGKPRRSGIEELMSLRGVEQVTAVLPLVRLLLERQRRVPLSRMKARDSSSMLGGRGGRTGSGRERFRDGAAVGCLGIGRAGSGLVASGCEMGRRWPRSVAADGRALTKRLGVAVTGCSFFGVGISLGRGGTGGGESSRRLR